jgi:hypothetical protein
MIRKRLLLAAFLLVQTTTVSAQQAVFSKDRIMAILETTQRDCQRQWSMAHGPTDERWDFIIEAVRRLDAASRREDGKGTVVGNWRRAVIGDLSMDGLSILMREPNGTEQWYFADVIVGAGGSNPRLTYNVIGMLRDSAGQYAPHGVARPDHPRFQAPVVGCGTNTLPGQPGQPPPSPPPPPVCPVCPPTPTKPNYPGDHYWVAFGEQLAADYAEAGQSLNGGSGIWFARVIYDHTINGMTLEDAVAKQRREWRFALGLGGPAAELSAYPLLIQSNLCWQTTTTEWLPCH